MSADQTRALTRGNPFPGRSPCHDLVQVPSDAEPKESGF